MFASRFTGRTWWWVSFLLFVVGLFVALSIYASNLSFWLQRADPVATFWSVAVAVGSIGLFVFMSIRRAHEIGAKPKWLLLNLLVIPVPFWIASLGFLPGKADGRPAPFVTFVRRRKVLVAISVAATAVLAGAWWWKVQQGGLVAPQQGETAPVAATPVPYVGPKPAAPSVACIGSGNSEGQSVLCFSSSP